MGKKLKTLVALALSAIMIMGLSITAFAGQNTVNTNYNVTFAFYQRDVTVANPVNTQVYSNITVSVPEGTTYMDALDDALAQEEAAVHTDFSAVWSGSGPYYLDALTLDDTDYVNNYTIIDTTYTGTSWMWDDNLIIDADYPPYYLDQVTVSDDTTVYLIFETSSFSW